MKGNITLLLLLLVAATAIVSASDESSKEATGLTQVVVGPNATDALPSGGAMSIDDSSSVTAVNTDSVMPRFPVSREEATELATQPSLKIVSDNAAYVTVKRREELEAFLKAYPDVIKSIYAQAISEGMQAIETRVNERLRAAEAAFKKLHSAAKRDAERRESVFGTESTKALVDHLERTFVPVVENMTTIAAEEGNNTLTPLKLFVGSLELSKVRADLPAKKAKATSTIPRKRSSVLANSSDSPSEIITQHNLFAARHDEIDRAVVDSFVRYAREIKSTEQLKESYDNIQATLMKQVVELYQLYMERIEQLKELFPEEALLQEKKTSPFVTTALQSMYNVIASAGDAFLGDLRKRAGIPNPK